MYSRSLSSYEYITEPPLPEGRSIGSVTSVAPISDWLYVAIGDCRYGFDYDIEMGIKPPHSVNMVGKFTLQREEKIFCIVFGSIFATSFLYDQAVRDFTQEYIYQGSNFFTEILYSAGDKDDVFWLGLTAFSVNSIMQDPYLHESLLLSAQSLLLTQGVTELFKKSFGRARPRQSPDSAFNFWGKSDSFFSGHSSGVWAYSTVIADRYPKTKWLAYGFASAVSLSRIYEDAHWTSDVMLGALVGYSFGRLTSRTSIPNAERINVLPYVDIEGQFILFQFAF